MPASSLHKHVLNECGHHTTSCPRCSATILYSNVSAHLRSECCSHILSRAFEIPQQSNAKARPTVFERLFQETVAELNAGLRQIVDDNKAQMQALTQVCHGVNSLREALDEKFAEAAVENRDSLAQNAADISCSVKEEVKAGLNEAGCILRDISQNVNSVKQMMGTEVITAMTKTSADIKGNTVKIGEVQREIRESSKKTMYFLTAALPPTSFSTAVAHLFSIKTISALISTATKNEKCDFACDQVCFRGYCMSPGVVFKKNGDSVLLHVRIKLYKGAIDDVLKWPFPYNLKLSVIHPDSLETREVTLRPAESYRALYFKPESTKGIKTHASNDAFLFSDLKSEGYVKDDKLELKYELFP